MSKVFSFRLNNSNANEAKAMDFLQTKMKGGINLRQIIIEALLVLSIQSSSEIEVDRISIKTALNSILELLKNGNQLDNNQQNKYEEINQISNVISDQFKNSLKREVKKGLQMDQ
jgi:hypothetical protein